MRDVINLPRKDYGKEARDQLHGRDASIKKGERKARQSTRLAYKVGTQFTGYDRKVTAKYEADVTKEAVDNIMNGFDKFIWDVSQSRITSFADIDFLTLYGNALNLDLNDDAVAHAALTAYFLKAIQRTYIGANKKDVVTANETALSQYMTNWVYYLFVLKCQKFYKAVIPNLTLHDTNANGPNAGPVIWTRNSWNNVLAHLSELGMPVPEMVLDFLDLLMFYVRYTEPYVSGNENRPESIQFYWKAEATYAEMYSDSDSVLIDGLLANLEKSKQIMDKFSIPYKTFDLSMLEIREAGLYSPDHIALLNHMYAKVKGTTTYIAQVTDITADMTTAYTGRKYFFHKNKPASFIHRVMRLLGPYNVTNNVDGLVVVENPSAIDKCSILKAGVESIAFSEADFFDTCITDLPCMFNGDGSDLKISVTLSGGTGSPVTLGETHFGPFKETDIQYGSGVTYVQNTHLLEGFFYMLALKKVKLNG